MAVTIITKSGSGVPAPADLVQGELAVDTSNGDLYTKLRDGNVVHVNDGVDNIDLSDYVTEAPVDNKQYARQNRDWSEVVIPDVVPPAWDDITGKPTEFPPASHNHDGVYQPVGDYLTDADSDGKQYARQDGAWSEVEAGGASVHIGSTPPVDPEEGQQWMEVPASGDANMWIYDGANWLEQPSSGGSGGGAAYDDSWIQPALDGKANVGDSYTKAEADSTFIDDAPADGELYVRKDGRWELYTPSSGGGGGFMVPVTPPSSAGNYVFGIKSNAGSGVFNPDMGSWYSNRSSTTATFTVPAGYKFVLQNFVANGDNKDVMYHGIYFDGKQIYTGSDTATAYKTTNSGGTTDYDKRYLWKSPQNFIIESSAVFTMRVSGSNWFHIFGYFIPADNTRESAKLREAYLKEEAERLAAMPVTQEISDE